MTENLQIALREKPHGKLAAEHFEAPTAARATPKEGEVQVHSVLLSLDAASRAWPQGATYKAAVNPGDVIGKLKVAQDIVEGLANAPAALVGLLAGENRGKRMIRISPDPS